MNVTARFRLWSLSVISLLLVPALQGADRTWTGAGGDSRWANPLNWAGNTAPAGNADQAIFPAGTPTACMVDATTSIKCIYFRNPGMTLSISNSVNLHFDNLGAVTMVAEQNATIDGEGTISFSVNTGENYADNQAWTGKTLTILAKITGANGFEHNGGGGTIVLANAANDQVGPTLLTAAGILSVPSVANAGLPSPLGAGSAFKVTYTPCTFRYTGTGGSTDRTFYQNAGAGQDATIEHAGSGTLTFTGPFLSGVNNAHAFIFNVVGSTAVIENSGVISNGGTAALWLYKQGAGKQVLSATNTYTGNTVVDAGTLAFTASGAISTSSLLRMRGGSLLLNAGTPADPYVALFGPLQVEVGVSSISVAAGATSAQVTFGSLTYVSGTIDFVGSGLGSTTKIFITGQPDGLIGSWATVNGGADLAAYSSTLGVYAAGLPVQTLQAMGASTITNDINSVARITEVGTSGGITLADNPTMIAMLSQEINTNATVSLATKALVAPLVQVASGASSLTIGDTRDDGTLTTSSNVLALANANAAAGAALTINATVTNNGATAVNIAKSGPGDVVLAGTIAHTGSTTIGSGTLTIDTAASTVRSLPTGVIGGNGGLTLTGSGTVAFPNVANTYASTTTVAQGTARILNNATFGTTTAPTVVKNGGAIDFWGITTANALRIGNEMVYAEGSGPDGNGALINNGTLDQFWSMTYLTLTGPTTVGGGRRLDVRGDNAASTYLNLNGYGITKKGTAQFGLTQTTVTNDQGTAFIDITQGNVTLEEYATLSGGSSNYIRVRNGAYFDLYNIRNPINWSFNMDSGSRINNRNGNATNMNIIAGPVTLSGTTTLTSEGTFIDTFAGAISGTGPLVKNGSEHSITYLRNTNNAWAGGATVSGGILYAPEPATLPGYATSITFNSTGCLAVRVANAAATQPGFSLAQINSILSGSSILSTGCSIGFDTQYESADYTYAMPDIGVRKFGPNTLLLSGSGANLGPVRIYGGTLDLSPVSRYLDDQNINVGYSTATADPIATLVVTNAAQITTLDRGNSVANQPQAIIGDAGRGIMRVSDSAKVAARVIVGNAAAGVGAVYQTGGTVHNTGGAANDGRIGGSGYGYYQLAGGICTNNGYSQIGQATTGVGILEQTGGQFSFSSVYGGNYGLSRGGTAVAHLSGGAFFSSVTLWVGDQNEASSSGGYAALTLTDTAVATVNGPIDLGNRNNMTAMLNLKGGTLNAGRVWRANRTGTEALVNWNGGLFRPNNTAETELFNGGVAGLYPEVTLYAGGAQVELYTNTLKLAVNTPLRAPALMGLLSIPVATPGTGYLGAPHIQITGGGGKGASAFAHVNLTNGTLTSIEIVSPGTGYTNAPTIALVGGGATTAATLGTPVMGLSSSGGLTKLGTGQLTLNATNTYTGTTEVREGTLKLGTIRAIAPRSSVSVTGGQLDLNGNSLTNENITLTGGTIVNGVIAVPDLDKNGTSTFDLRVPVTLSTVHGDPTLIPGLWEGRLAGAMDTTTPNPQTSIQMTTRAVNGWCNSGGTINGALWPDNSTYVYSGYIWNRATTNVTWTFAENFDDSVLLRIDGATVLNNGTWNTPTKANVTLSPGPHMFEARFGQGGGGAAGNVAGWWTANTMSFAVDFQGRNAETFANYTLLTDVGDGSLLTLNRPEIYGAGLKESVIFQNWNTTDDGTLISRQLTTQAGNGTKSANTTFAGGLWNGNNHTWIYKGILWNRATTNVTWTWRFTFDDNVLLKIDNTVVRNVALGEGVVLQNHTLTPGPHSIEIRFGDGTGDVGPASGLGGLTYDPQGRSSSDANDYQLLQDTGNGALLTTDLEAGYDRPVVNVNAGILRSSLPLVGLREGRINTRWDTTTDNPSTSTQLTTRAANGWCNSGGTISGAYWPDNSTYVYSGYIWNRAPTNETWTFAENFDDQVLLRIDGINVLNDGAWSTPTKGTITLTPGPHAFDLRLGQGGGGAGGNVAGWWTDKNYSFGVDFLGRGADVLSNYVIPTDTGNGALFTLTTVDPLAYTGMLDRAVANLATGAVLDLNGEAQKVAAVTGTGILSNGTLVAGSVLSPAGDAAVGSLTLKGVTLGAGVTYQVTISGSQSDSLVTSGAMDLSGVTLVPATGNPMTSTTYVIAQASGGFTGAKPTVSGFPPKYKIIVRGTEMLLTSQYGSILLFR